MTVTTLSPQHGRRYPQMRGLSIQAVDLHSTEPSSIVIGFRPIWALNSTVMIGPYPPEPVLR